MVAVLPSVSDSAGSSLTLKAVTRLLAIGLDAADRSLVGQLIAAGRLPNLAALAAHGQEVAVHHPWPYRAELPWTTFLTGEEAARRHYWGTVRFDPATYGTVEGGALKAEPFYADLGHPVVAFDVPHSVLSGRVEGLQVTAWGAHSPQYPRASRPVGLLTEIDRGIGPHPAFDADSQPGWWSEPYQTSLTAALLEGIRRRTEAMALLLRRQPDWRLALTVFSEPHSAGHHLWHGVDVEHPLHHHAGAAGARARLVAVYEAVDEAVGELRALVERDPEPTAVAVFAVHGTRSNQGDLLAMYLVPELLHRVELGWNKLRSPRRSSLAPGGFVDLHRRQPAFDALAPLIVGDRDRNGATPPGLRDAALDRARVLGRRLRPRRDPRWYQLLADAPSEARYDDPAEVRFDARTLDYQGALAYRPYWSEQRCFVLPTFSDVHIRVNLRGRERAGKVAAGDYRRELDRIEALLARCRDRRSGRAVVADVARPKEVDPHDPEAPPADLVVLGALPTDAIDHPQAGRIGPVPFLRTGEHGGEGFLILTPAPGAPLPESMPVTALGRTLRDLALQERQANLQPSSALS